MLERRSGLEKPRFPLQSPQSQAVRLIWDLWEFLEMTSLSSVSQHRVCTGRDGMYGNDISRQYLAGDGERLHYSAQSFRSLSNVQEGTNLISLMDLETRID